MVAWDQGVITTGHGSQGDLILMALLVVCELSREGSRQDSIGRVILKVAGVDAAATREGTGLTTGGTRTTSGVCSVKGCSTRVRAIAVS